MNSRNLTNLSSFVFVEKVNDDIVSVNNLADVLVRDDRAAAVVVVVDDDDDDDNDDDSNDCILTLFLFLLLRGNRLARVSELLSHSTSRR